MLPFGIGSSFSVVENQLLQSELHLSPHYIELNMIEILMHRGVSSFRPLPHPCYDKAEKVAWQRASTSLLCTLRKFPARIINFPACSNSLRAGIHILLYKGQGLSLLVIDSLKGTGSPYFLPHNLPSLLTLWQGICHFLPPIVKSHANNFTREGEAFSLWAYEKPSCGLMEKNITFSHTKPLSPAIRKMNPCRKN